MAHKKHSNRPIDFGFLLPKIDTLLSQYRDNQQEEVYEELRLQGKKIIRGFDVDAFFLPYAEGMRMEMRTKIVDYFLTLHETEFISPNLPYGKWNLYRKYDYARVTPRNLDDFIASFCVDGRFLSREYGMEILGYSPDYDFPEEYVLDYMERQGYRESPLFQCADALAAVGLTFVRDDLMDRMIDRGIGRAAFDGVLTEFTYAWIERLLEQNSRYAKVFEKRREMREEEERLKQSLLDAIPDSYIDLFPLARRMQRHFVLHIGPTNSGKSYEALNALKQARNGIYLAPLRLLAFEKYEELNEDGVPCSMKTGEEEISMENARVQSSTIEMASFVKQYDIAVIDEAQMMADTQRGSAWTMAVLGICAPLIHVCLAPECEHILVKMIEECADTYEIRRHQRLVPLKVEELEERVFPYHAQRGDAFIVFSRKEAHQIASELMEAGTTCSLVYGRLPYDVRRSEVRKYISGQTDVVVATDAIGMGLNLPIRRIIFLRTQKFDGVARRDLTGDEVRQIAGRAGRFGIFEEGTVIFEAEGTPPSVPEALVKKPDDIVKAAIGFPTSLIGMEGTVSSILKQWQAIPPKEGYLAEDVSREIDLSELLEKEMDDKDLIYKLISLKFDETDEELKKLWLKLCRMQYKGTVDLLRYIPGFGSEELYDLEEAYKICDLLYRFSEAFEHDAEREEISFRKEQISEKINAILAVLKPRQRYCRKCARRLPEQSHFLYCDDCYRKMKKHHRGR